MLRITFQEDNREDLWPSNPKPITNMASTSSQSSNNTNKKANSKAEIAPIPIKKIDFRDGISILKWTEQEVNRMNIIENFQYAIVCKFSYGWPESVEMRE